MNSEKKELLFAAEDEIANQAEAVSRFIYEHPERGDEEFVSSAFLAEEAKKLGFDVTYPYMGLPTAFCAELKNGDGPVVAFLAEYDALPGYGPNKDQMAHACGHNWIAASTCAAAAALAGIKDQWKGTVRWIGTPAEETSGKKVNMAREGVFDDIDAVFQMHLSSESCVDTVALAMSDFVFEFFGKASHASGNPMGGINALDACTLTLAGINALRQHVESDTRIHAIITHGGRAANVIPDYGRMEVFVRAGQKDYLEEVIGKVLNCGRGAALMTGCRFEWERNENTYFDIKRNVTLNEKMKGYLAEQLRGLSLSEFKPLSTPLKKEQFIQVTIVVDDIKRAAKAWAALLDVPEPEIWVNHLQSNGEYPYTYRGEDVPCDLQMCVIDMGSWMLELHQVDGTPSTFREFQDKHLFGVHHLGFEVGDDRDEVIRELNALGFDTSRTIGIYPGSSWTIVDTEDVLGVNLNIKPKR